MDAERIAAGRRRYEQRMADFRKSLVVETGICDLCARRSSIEAAGPVVRVPVVAQMNMHGRQTVKVCGGCLKKWYNIVLS
jgi:hypothetical protein